MSLKYILTSISFCLLLSISAQEFDYNNLDMASLDYSQIAETDGFDYYGPRETQSLQTSVLVVNNLNQAELEAYLNMMLLRRHPMEKTGRILTYIGVPLAIIGGIMVAGADELYYECINGNCTGDARGGFGVVLLGAGSGLSITGAILWIVGSKK